ncbi:MAG: DUF748 domain-containing protein [Chromatiales bacterium]|nr:DUF748 domain-containing protein [Chromatiales bacterium]
MIQLTNGELTLSGLGLRRHEEGEPFARLPRLEARDLALNWPEQAVAIGDIFVADAWLLVTRESGGQLDLTSLLTMPVEPARGADQALAGPQDGADSPGQGWRWRLGGLEATGLSLDIEDRVPAATGRLALRDIGLAVGGISSALPEPFPVELALLLDSGGRIELGGQARVVPEVALDLRLAIDELGLAVVQPWLGEVLAARLDDGHLSAALALRVDPGKGPRLTGSTRVARLALGEPGSEATLLAWQKLSADGIRLSLDDSRLEISELLLDAPFVRLLIDTDGELNLAGLLRMTATDPAGPDHDAAPVEPLAVTVGELRIADGAADFTDLALPFPFRAEITALSGRIGVLDTASLAPAEVSLSGQVADYGEARLNGEISLANPVARTDLALSFRNVAIPDLSAYTVRFAGRRIADGRMDLDLRYRIDKAELRADHRLVLRRLALGEREHFPGAARLPLSLAIALLRGPDGTIDLELPVTGNIDDPRFELGSLILQTFTNLVTRITTAPFRLLGQLIGSTEEDLGVVLFRPGEAELAPPEREKLAQLAQALALRPALSVEVPAVSAGDADRRVLQKKQLEKRLAERTAAVDEQDQRSRLERERDALEALFAERTPAGSLEDLREQFERLLDPENPDGATALDFAAWITALRERLAAIEPVDDEALDELGRARRAAIMDWLQERRPDMAAQVLAGGVATRAPDGEGLIPLALEATAN